MRRDCWYDGKLLNVSERFVVDRFDLRILATFLYTADVEPNAGIGLERNRLFAGMRSKPIQDERCPIDSQRVIRASPAQEGSFGVG